METGSAGTGGDGGAEPSAEGCRDMGMPGQAHPPAMRALGDTGAMGSPYPQTPRISWTPQAHWAGTGMGAQPQG